MDRKKILIFASGTEHGGGSGFENLVNASRNGVLDAEIVGVVSNHMHGGVHERAQKLTIPFIHFTGPWTRAGYQKIASESKADFFILSGWLKLVTGLDNTTAFSSRTIINIHPGPLPEFGGAGLYGAYVHRAVIEAYKSGAIANTALCMHFVTDSYDRGPVFFRYNIPIHADDTAESLGLRVQQYEHEYQPKITDMVVRGLITWDGVNHDSLKVPRGYLIESSTPR